MGKKEEKWEEEEAVRERGSHLPRAGEQEVGSAGRKASSTPDAQPIFVKQNLTPGQRGTEDKLSPGIT